MSYDQKAKDAKRKASRIALPGGSEKGKLNELARVAEELADAILELGEDVQELKKEIKK